jgi:hypothetical protein
MLQFLEEQFDPPVDLDLNAHLRHSFKVMQDEVQSVKLSISPARGLAPFASLGEQEDQTFLHREASLARCTKGAEPVPQW